MLARCLALLVAMLLIACASEVAPPSPSTGDDTILGKADDVLDAEESRACRFTPADYWDAESWEGDHATGPGVFRNDSRHDAVALAKGNNALHEWSDRADHALVIGGFVDHIRIGANGTITPSGDVDWYRVPFVDEDRWADIVPRLFIDQWAVMDGAFRDGLSVCMYYSSNHTWATEVECRDGGTAHTIPTLTVDQASVVLRGCCVETTGENADFSMWLNAKGILDEAGELLISVQAPRHATEECPSYRVSLEL